MSLEKLEYIICPQCKNQIKIDWDKNLSSTNDIFRATLWIPAYTKQTPKKERTTRIEVTACNHCKEIIGTNKF